MTHRKFVEQMFDLTVKLTHSVEHYGYRSKEYMAVLEEIGIVGSKFNRRRRRRDWLMILLLWISLGALVGLVLRILYLN